MFIASATASGDQFSYQEVNNSGATPKRLAATGLSAAFSGGYFGSGGTKAMVTFGSELLAAAVAGPKVPLLLADTHGG